MLCLKEGSLAASLSFPPACCRSVTYPRAFPLAHCPAVLPLLGVAHGSTGGCQPPVQAASWLCCPGVCLRTVAFHRHRSRELPALAACRLESAGRAAVPAADRHSAPAVRCGRALSPDQPREGGSCGGAQPVAPPAWPSPRGEGLCRRQWRCEGTGARAGCGPLGKSALRKAPVCPVSPVTAPPPLFSPCSGFNVGSD